MQVQRFRLRPAPSNRLCLSSPASSVPLARYCPAAALKRSVTCCSSATATRRIGRCSPATAPRRIVPTMVEGHQCHRVGHAHRRLLLGKRFLASSPNGRFAEGAAAISGKLLSRIEIHGKNLFYFFSGSLSSDASAQQQQGPHIPILQPIDEDPLQSGDLDSDSEGRLGDTAAVAAAAAAAAAAVAAAAAAAPTTPARRTSRKSSSPVVSPASLAAAAAAGGSSPVTPNKPLLAAFGSAAAAALSGRGHTSLAAAAAAATPAPATPGAAAAATAGPSAGPSAAASAAAAGAEDVVIVHIHFGMSGAFRTASLPGPDPTPTTRLRLVHESTGLMAHLSAMTVAHGGLELYQEKVSKLGPDPLRPDDDCERFWARVHGSKKPIGLLLMDQTAVAGVGNIYRAEILYKTGLHPEQPGFTVDRDTFDVLWGHCVDLLHRGFTSGSILTVDPEDARLLGKPWTRRYIYNQRQCGRCKGPVKVWDMAGRTVYCCETCQPLRLPAASTAAAAPSAAAAGNKPGRKGRSRGGASSAAAAAAAAAGAEPADSGAVAAQLLTPSRLKSMAAAKVAQEFVSHCAPDDPSELQPSKMTCEQLRTHLKALNMDTRGNKPQLVCRLEAAKGWMGAVAAAAGDAGGASPPAAAAAGGRKGAGADSDREVVLISDNSSSDESGDDLDKAEDALAARLSVPPAKKRRRTAAAAAAGGVASAKAAEAEKAAAGENRAVEHVALHADEWTDALMFGGSAGGAAADGEVAGAGTPAPAKPRARTRRSRVQ